jgi:hypothetical protein
MARDHARIQTAIWDDPDFLALKVAEQHAYFMLVSNLGLSRCGVITFIPARFEHLASDLTAAKLRKAIDGLRSSRFALVDQRTQEILVRSYVRHDGVLDRLNMGKATGTAFEAVVSADLKAAIGVELARHMKDKPDLQGWEGLAATSPTAHAMACGMACPMESRMP